MDKQKHIEEITEIIDRVQTYGTKWYPDKYEPFDVRIDNDDIAYELFNAGYRKIPEGAVVLTRAHEDKIFNDYVEYIKKVRKETAEKFAERLKELEEANKQKEETNKEKNNFK